MKAGGFTAKTRQGKGRFETHEGNEGSGDPWSGRMQENPEGAWAPGGRCHSRPSGTRREVQVWDRTPTGLQKSQPSDKVSGRSHSQVCPRWAGSGWHVICKVGLQAQALYLHFFPGPPTPLSFPLWSPGPSKPSRLQNLSRCPHPTALQLPPHPNPSMTLPTSGRFIL